MPKIPFQNSVVENKYRNNVVRVKKKQSCQNEKKSNFSTALCLFYFLFTKHNPNNLYNPNLTKHNLFSNPRLFLLIYPFYLFLHSITLNLT